jgi:hypothetical protein
MCSRWKHTKDKTRGGSWFCRETKTGGQMKFTPLLALVLLVLCGCAEGPFYRIESVHSRGASTEIILTRLSRRPTDWFWREANYNQFDYFMAQAVGGELSDVRALGRCRWDESARFAPVVGNDGAYLRELFPPYPQKTIQLAVVSPGKSKRLVDETSTWAGELTKSAIGWTRDGRHLLVVDERGLRVIDVVSGGLIELAREDPLIELRRAMVEQYGVAGTWWLSNDLRHVIIAPPKYTYAYGGSKTPEDINIDTGCVRLRTGQGAIYDRGSGIFQVFAQEVWVTPHGRWRMFVRDAEYVDGRILLLYAGTDQLLICTPDLSEQHYGKLQFTSDDLDALVYTDWQPQQQRVIALECTDPQQLSIPRSEVSPNYVLHRWRYDTGKTETSKIPGAAVVRAIGN